VVREKFVDIFVREKNFRITITRKDLQSERFIALISRWISLVSIISHFGMVVAL
jgi:hypothetical protein